MQVDWWEWNRREVCCDADDDVDVDTDADADEDIDTGSADDTAPVPEDDGGAGH